MRTVTGTHYYPKQLTLSDNVREQVAGRSIRAQRTGFGSPGPYAVAIGVVLLYGLLFELWMMAAPFEPSFKNSVSDIADTIVPAIAVLLCFRFLDRQPGKPAKAQLVTAPHLLAAGVLSYSLGSLVWDYYDLVLHQPPFPSWADAFYLSTDPIFLAGILLLPIRRVSRMSRLHLSLESVVVMAAVVTFSWFFVLGPTILAGSAGALAKVVGVSYPVSDLVLVLCMLLLLIRTQYAGLTWPFVGLAMSIGFIVVVDSVFSYQTLNGSYNYSGGNVVDAGWSVGYALVAIAAVSLRKPLRTLSDTPVAPEGVDTSDDAPVRLWSSVLAYVLVPAVAALMAYVSFSHAATTLKVGVYVSGIVMLAAVFAHQIVLLTENNALLRRVSALKATLRQESRLDNLAQSQRGMDFDELLEAMRERKRSTAVPPKSPPPDNVYHARSRHRNAEASSMPNAGDTNANRFYKNLTYFWILGIPPDSSVPEIDRAFRQWLAQEHPDKWFFDLQRNREATERLRDLNIFMAEVHRSGV